MSLQEFLHNLAFGTELLFTFGNIGSGKTAFNFKILELIHQENPSRPVYLLSFPEEAVTLIPDWINIVQNIHEVPNGSLILKDDTALDDTTSSKSKNSQQREFVKQLILFRQKKYTVLFTVQSAAFTSLDLYRVGKTSFVFRYYDKRSLFYEREELREAVAFFMELLDEHQKTTNTDMKSLGFCDSPYYQGILKNQLPTFWSEDLSCILGAV